jgi:hypothetical protein
MAAERGLAPETRDPCEAALRLDGGALAPSGELGDDEGVDALAIGFGGVKGRPSHALGQLPELARGEAIGPARTVEIEGAERRRVRRLVARLVAAVAACEQHRAGLLTSARAFGRRRLPEGRAAAQPDGERGGADAEGPLPSPTVRPGRGLIVVVPRRDVLHVGRS